MSNNIDRFKVPRTKTMAVGQVDLARVDATTYAQIRQQKTQRHLRGQIRCCGLCARYSRALGVFSTRVRLAHQYTFGHFAQLGAR